MSRLLVTRLPQEVEEVVSAQTYNRLIRVLEINLAEFDPDNTRQIEDTEKGKISFNAGSLVWNTNNETLEVWTGSKWLPLSTAQNDHGLSATGSVGEVTLKLDGATTITL
jgi:hypothetical protein